MDEAAEMLMGMGCKKPISKLKIDGKKFPGWCAHEHTVFSTYSYEAEKLSSWASMVNCPFFHKSDL